MLRRIRFALAAVGASPSCDAFDRECDAFDRQLGGW
jgi:hypothetical protein